MVVDRSARRCLLCDAPFTGRAFLCRSCADRYRGQDVPIEVRRQFYEAIDRVYPDWSNTYGHYNPPRALLEFAARLPRAARLLEVGAGGGFTLEALRQLGFEQLIGSDLTGTTLAAMRGRLGRVHLVAVDAEALPFQARSFDVVLSTDLIEHLPDLDRHLAEVARLLRPGGHYLIKTPNRLLADLYYRARGLYDAFFWHPSMCSPCELRSALGRHGFSCQFLSTARLTSAQTRKIPIVAVRPLVRRIPIDRLPLAARPHLEAVATLRATR